MVTQTGGPTQLDRLRRPACPRGDSVSEAVHSPETVPHPTSLDDLETNVHRLEVPGTLIPPGQPDPPRWAYHPLMVQTAAQNRLHAPHASTRLRLLDALMTGSEQLHERAVDSIGGCCDSPIFCASADGRPRMSLCRCRHRLCPFCMKIRARETARRISRLVVGVNSPRLITLTLREDGEPLAARLDRLAASFRNLRRQRRWKLLVHGGVYCTEVTTGEERNGWHVHLHIIVDGEYFPQADLSSDWEIATGDSPIVDIRAVTNREKAAYYVSKYVAKCTDLEEWTDEQICEYAVAMHRRRIVSTFGTAHNVKSDASATPEECEPATAIMHVEPILHAARGGDAHALQILDFAGRLGPRWRAAFGIAPTDPREPVPLALSADDECAMVECVRWLADEIAGRNHTPPDTPPPRAPLQPMLIEIHQVY